MMRILIYFSAFCLLACLQHSKSILFFQSTNRITCKCFFEKTGKSAQKSYSFTYSNNPIEIGRHHYFVAKSDYFVGGRIYLREQSGKVYGLRDSGFEETLLADFNLIKGDTLRRAPTLEFTFRHSYFDKTLGEEIFHYELSKNSREIADGCTNVGFDISKSWGFVKLEYRCSDQNDFYCSVKQLR